MNEKDFKTLLADRSRLVKIIVIQGVILTAVLTIAIVFGTIQLSNIKRQLQELRSSPRIVRQEISPQQIQELRLALVPNGKPGQDGKDGSPGANGRDGLDGKDGLNVTPQQIAQAVTTYLQQNPPPKGDTGKPGKDGKNGREIQLCTIELGVLGFKYVGDAECQEPL